MKNLAIAAEPVPLEEDAHGVIRIGGTRVTLDTVISAFQEGLTAEEKSSSSIPLSPWPMSMLSSATTSGAGPRLKPTSRARNGRPRRPVGWMKPSSSDCWRAAPDSVGP